MKHQEEKALRENIRQIIRHVKQKKNTEEQTTSLLLLVMLKESPSVHISLVQYKTL